jgi:hypothetical protein
MLHENHDKLSLSDFDIFCNISKKGDASRKIFSVFVLTFLIRLVKGDEKKGGM